MATAKRSFWHFGGKLDKIYNWLLVLIFTLSFLVHTGQYGKGHLPEALGAAIGQTVVAAVLLFVLFKIISPGTNRESHSRLPYLARVVAQA